MCEQMQAKGICILMRHPSHIMQRPPAGYNKGTGIRITLVCRHMLEEGSIKPDTLVYPFYVNPPSLNRSGQIRSHHAYLYNLLTCTWSCSCFRYSMASSSMDALSVLLEFGIRLCSAFIFSLILLLLLCAPAGSSHKRGPMAPRPCKGASAQDSGRLCRSSSSLA